MTIKWPIEILQNKYALWYEQIVLRAQQRTLPKDTYTEIHHIIPKCLNGDDSLSNLTKLTAREHFICHWLLTKMLPVTSKKRNKMFFALHMMRANNPYQQRYTTKITSRVYEKIRFFVSEARKELPSSLKGRPLSEATRKKLSEAGKGRICAIETRKKISEANKGKKKPPVSEATSKKISEKAKGRKMPPRTEEWCEKMSNLFKGRIQTNEWRIKNSVANKGKGLKLTDMQVKEIRDKYVPRKYSQSKLAKEYNVHRETICNIIKNRIYVNLSGETK